MEHIGISPTTYFHLVAISQQSAGNDTFGSYCYQSIEGGCGWESQHWIVWHINIWAGGPLLSLLWPPLGAYIPVAGGAALQSALGHPERCMVESTCHWRVITQTAANASFSRSQSSTANSQDPLSSPSSRLSLL